MPPTAGVGVRDVAISAIGEDRPGIVAALSAGLLAVDGNLSDCRAALLGGSFAIVLVVTLPDHVDDAALDVALRPIADRLGLGLMFAPAARAETSTRTERCLVSVYGADHPGILHTVAAALAALGVNVLDLSTRLVGEPPLFVVGIEAALPEGVSLGTVERALRPEAERQSLELSILPLTDEVM